MSALRLSSLRVSPLAATLLLLALALGVAHLFQLQYFCDDSYISYRQGQRSPAEASVRWDRSLLCEKKAAPGLRLHQ